MTPKQKLLFVQHCQMLLESFGEVLDIFGLRDSLWIELVAEMLNENLWVPFLNSLIKEQRLFLQNVCESVHLGKVHAIMSELLAVIDVDENIFILSV